MKWWRMLRRGDGFGVETESAITQTENKNRRSISAEFAVALDERKQGSRV
jgi:hypothetical protein